MSTEKVSKEKTKIMVGFFGSTEAGKTKLIDALSSKENRFSSDEGYVPTDGTAFKKITPIENLEIFLADNSGAKKLPDPPYNMFKEEVNVICINQNDPDSLKIAGYHAKKIKELDKNAQIIIAITKTDLPPKISAEAIEDFKEKQNITSKTIETSAKQGTGINELRTSIIDLARDLKAEKSGKITPDRVFLNAFKSGFLDYLKQHVYVREKLEQAEFNIGQLSRIFDNLDLPVVDRTVLEQKLEKVGSALAYMRPILNEVAEKLLNKERTRLSDEVIEAIGEERYKQMITAIMESEQIGNNRALVEEEVAKHMLAAIMTVYALNLQEYSLTPKEKDCRQNNQLLFDQIEALKNKIKDLRGELPSYEKQKVKVEDIEIDDANRRIIDLSDKIQKFLDSPKEKISESDVSDMLEILSEAEPLRQAIDSKISDTLNKFTNSVVIPIQVMATNFSLIMLDEPKENIPLDVIEAKADIFFTLVDDSFKKLRKKLSDDFSAKNPNHQGAIPDDYFKTSEPLEALRLLKDRLETARSVNVVMESASDNTKRDYVLNKYQDAINIFLKSVDDDTLKVESPNVRDLWDKIKEAIKSFSFAPLWDTQAEKEEKKRFENQTNLKLELESIKEATKKEPSEKQSTKLDIPPSL
ncbi:ADP-ribosylation factor-like protein [Legionella sp. WA2024007413]